MQQYEDAYLDVAEVMKSAMGLRYRDLIGETVQEFSRMENFCRIYPARNSKLYDKFFSGHKQLNKLLYKVFYTGEVLPYERSGAEKSANITSGKANGLMA